MLDYQQEHVLVSWENDGNLIKAVGLINKITKPDQTSELIDPKSCYLHETCWKTHHRELGNIQFPGIH